VNIVEIGGSAKTENYINSVLYNNICPAIHLPEDVAIITIKIRRRFFVIFVSTTP